jgi:CheY-like chemotaxis protein
VVEDDQNVRDAVSDVLRDEGYHVETAANGSEALSVIAKNRPSLIFLDLMMPVMNGYELLDALRATATFRTIPVVVMTAFSNANSVRDVPVLMKPMSVENILRAAQAYTA